MANSISPWANTQAVQEVACPHCGSPATVGCVLPTGRRYHDVHWQRTKAYREKIGVAEWTRRHTRGAEPK